MLPVRTTEESAKSLPSCSRTCSFGLALLAGSIATVLQDTSEVPKQSHAESCCTRRGGSASGSCIPTTLKQPEAILPAMHASGSFNEPRLNTRHHDQTPLHPAPGPGPVSIDRSETLTAALHGFWGSPGIGNDQQCQTWLACLPRERLARKIKRKRPTGGFESEKRCARRHSTAGICDGVQCEFARRRRMLQVDVVSLSSRLVGQVAFDNASTLQADHTKNADCSAMCKECTMQPRIHVKKTSPA